MPHYSVSSMFFHEYKVEKIFDCVSKAGCTSIEFWLETPDFWLNGLPEKKLRNVLTGHKNLIPFTVHSPVLDLNPCSVNPDIAEVSIQSTEKAIEMSEAIGAQIITIHPGRRTAKRKPGERDFQRLENYLKRIKTAQDKKNIMVAIENMQPKINSLLSTPESLSKLLEENNWLYFTLDIAHALKASEKDSFRYIDLLFDRIINVHVSGANQNKTHTLPHSDENVKKILTYLSDCGYNRHLTLELEDLNLGRRYNHLEKTEIISNEINFIKNIFEK